MPVFRKKPVVVEAIQLTENNIAQVYAFIYGEIPKLTCMLAEDRWTMYEDIVKRDGMQIKTLEDGKYSEAKHVASINDWIIKGVKDEFYPCKPDIFEQTYELVTES